MATALTNVAFAQDNAPYRYCKGQQNSNQLATSVSCNLINEVIDALQQQLAFLVESRVGFDNEAECARQYEYALRKKDANPKLVVGQASYSLAVCNKAITRANG